MSVTRSRTASALLGIGTGSSTMAYQYQSLPEQTRPPMTDRELLEREIEILEDALRQAQADQAAWLAAHPRMDDEP